VQGLLRNSAQIERASTSIRRIRIPSRCAWRRSDDNDTHCDENLALHRARGARWIWRRELFSLRRYFMVTWHDMTKLIRRRQK